MIGAVLAIAAAGGFGFNTAIVRRATLRAAPYTLIVISITAAAPIFALIALVAGEWARAGDLHPISYVVLALTGVMNFLGGRYSSFRAIKAIGANLTAPVRMLNVLFSVLLGAFLLHEHVSPLRGAGIALLVVAPLIAFSQPSAMRKALQSGTAFQLAEGLIFGLIAAGSYGGAAFLLRDVLANTGLALLGAFVAHAGASLVLIASLAFERNRTGLRRLDGTDWKLFALVTLTMVVSQVFRFSALASAPVSVVAPLIETMSFFGLGFAYLINRKTESFSPLVIVGMLLAIVGVVAITL